MTKYKYLLVFLLMSIFLEANDKVSLQLKWKHQFQFAGFYAAIEKGYYKEAGLDITLKEMDAYTSIDDVVNGISDFGIEDSSVIYEYIQGKPLTGLMAIYQHSPNILLGIKKHQNKNVKPIIAIPTNSISNLNVQVMMHQLHNEYTTINPTWTRDIDDLIEGKITYFSAYRSNEPYQIEKRGYEPIIYDPKDYGIDFYGDILYTSNKLLKSNPDLVKRFYDATYKGWRYAFLHTDEIIELILEKYNSQHKTKDALQFEAKELINLADVNNFGKLEEKRINDLKTLYLINNNLTLKSMKKNSKSFIYEYNKVNDFSKQLSLSDEEKEFLKAKKTFTICARYNHFPVSGVKDSKLIGISGEVFSEIGLKLGIDFQIKEFNSQKEQLQAIKNHECDMISALRSGFDGCEYIKTSTPIFKTYFASLGNTKSFVFDDLSNFNGHRFYVKDIVQKEILNKNYPNLDVKLEADIDKIMKIVEADNYTHYVNNFINIDYAIQKYGADKFRFNGMFQKITADGSIGVDIKNNPLLLEIIDKTLADIGDKRLNEIVNQYQIKEFKIEKNYNNFLLGALIFIGFIFWIYFVRSLEISKQKRLLENEKEKLQVLIDNSTDAVHILDKDGILIEASLSFIKQLGYKNKEELLGKHVSTWDVGLLQIEKDAVQNVIATPRLFTTKHKRKDGSIIPVQVNAAKIEIGKNIHLYASARDLTDSLELKEIKKLREKDAIFLEILNHSPSKIAYIDQNYTYIALNNRYAQFFDKTTDEIIGKNVQDIVGKEVFEKIIEPNLKKALGGEVVVYETNMKGKYLHVEYKPYIEDGKISPSGVIVSLTNITTIVQAHQKESELLLTLEKAHKINKSGSWTCDIATGRFTYDKNLQQYYNLNKATCEFEEITNRFVNEEEVNEAKKYFERTIEEKRGFSFIHSFKVNDEIRYIDAVWDVELDSNGDVVRGIGMDRDITVQVLAQKEKEKQQALLIKQSRFAQMGEMIAMIAHQWRQPLNSLNMWVDNLIYVTKTNQDPQMIDQIQTNVQKTIHHLSQTITDFGNFFKPDKEVNRFSINEMINGTLGLISDKIKHNDIKIRIDLEENLEHVGFQNELSQVILVIIDNSIDQLVNIKNQERSLTIKGALQNEMITLELCDNGGGVPLDIKDKIFDPYFSTKSLNGTGVGLYMAKVIVEQSMKGSISVYNTKEGACFKLMFQREIRGG